MVTIRFIKNVMITTTSTGLVDGKLVVSTNQHMIRSGDTYKAEDKVVHGNLVDIDFGTEGSIKGVANNLDASLLEIREPVNNPKSGGCGCGKKKSE